ncbi:polysaccharide biosynthesis protein [Thiohalomonas denitrificans]|uniref:NDP-sugar epimerase, includes UDP-GlcNAc-inverting 4,6-dehydratase FlaA1 and capsular polysaccharide biosynthesis protein EpsC n=1 Tax=Thiohalomonas denitrificans TaxID=415747 RepID=A0A1G5QIZ6_9GAMM|nr:nucleoside-diphosphate sugar epimerase/dehydratase [Thiohalomonas denitrificans]SCZ61566.1 NDP-sugar epimerase, includes UDP-GlcNAc-inverting 4,6-dehydratase FlaA1 and capsular polysaccharide biosynthesis protein EpsC [Thiohalomonas denitrificans]
MKLPQTLARSAGRAPLLIVDMWLIPVLLWCAFALRSGTLPPDLTDDRKWLLLFSVVASVVPFIRLGLYRAVTRYIGQEAAFVIIQGVTTAALLLFGLAWLFQLEADPAVFIIFWAIVLIYVGGSRFAIRAYYRHRAARRAKAVGIYGAGDAGRQLAAAINSGNQCHVRAFFDDDPSLDGVIIDGTPVFNTHDIQHVVQQRGLHEIFLALPSASRHQRQQALRRVEFLPVRIRTVPHLGELVVGLARVDELRDIDLEDLLERAPVEAKMALLTSSANKKNVMVTGAGGTIGSELCRKIIDLNPVRVVLYEMSEYALYAIEKELREANKYAKTTIAIHPVLSSVRDSQRVAAVMAEYGIDLVFHAAAYKHVPMLEENIAEGVLNNVIGTWNVAEAAVAAQAATFVLVSTDKAVRPTNLMGATKRMSELVVQAIQERERQGESKTDLCIVRFGNVLGSSGSVVPHFKEQIRRGGPITVTHPEVIRYFMTVPEAAQLVLQASAMSRGGDVFLLDMGAPVKIHDLAKKMIHLMGFIEKTDNNQSGDIAIEFTGLRPGEKLYEELLVDSEAYATEHPKIMRAQEGGVAWNEIEEPLHDLWRAADENRIEEVIEILKACVPEYTPGEGVCSQCSAEQEYTGGLDRSFAAGNGIE